VSIFVSSVSCAAGSFFATLFSSDCRLCGTPLINIPRLAVCQPCFSGIRPITGGLGSVCGERLLTPYPVVAGQEKRRCGLCRSMVSECARVLRRAGASKLDVATVARTLKADATSGGLLPNLAEAGTQDEGMLAAS
jgi:predicted amidophosphoribosyltransferase